ncbi:unnamed protein product [Cyprideis torosa]|uniref:Uncharacterized protein n=1 Tax=Cyprideis torosa TaxID=163714 RepID=A0A7R8ZGP4_9CRUS|nr:unnamed protein product [Cyprideis torosa]CAG0880658.1 unnamed protein product [Cyprideis torosa]
MLVREIVRLGEGEEDGPGGACGSLTCKGLSRGYSRACSPTKGGYQMWMLSRDQLSSNFPQEGNWVFLWLTKLQQEKVQKCPDMEQHVQCLMMFKPVRAYTFEVTLTKVNKSLGFTVKKNDNSVLGHCIKELVKEPALSNGNLMPGDKIISVNGVDISPMSHSEAVAFLRACSDEVTLVLYRDDPIAQTPLSPLSPDDYPIMSRTPQLRVEAREMLEEIAFARNSPSFTMEGSPGSPGSTAGGYSSLGRRRRRKEGGSIGSTGPRPTSLDFDGVKKQRYVFTPPASASHPADEEEGDSDSPRVFTFTETTSNGDNAGEKNDASLDTALSLALCEDVYDDEDIIEGGPLDRHRGSIPIVVTPGAPILEPLSPDAPDAVEIVTLESELGGDMPMSQAEPSGVEFPKTPGGDEVDRGGFRPPPPPAFASTPKSDKDAQDRSDFYHDMDSQPMSLPSTAFLDQSEHLNNNDIQNDDDRSSDEQMTMGGLLKWRGARIEDRGSNIGDDSVEVSVER